MKKDMNSSTLSPAQTLPCSNGTAKELVANAVHRQSHRRKDPFVVSNCSAYSPTLLESEIFGEKKAHSPVQPIRKRGRIERARGGTLFPDEIGETVPSVQMFLMRFLQGHCYIERNRAAYRRPDEY
ncbi:MAG: sigma 54-interacting transcriptional regulator [Syntrophobacteraceae bacterium]|jgi:transcriptional regulator with GAF, ATPase, and Fis domain